MRDARRATRDAREGLCRCLRVYTRARAHTHARTHTAGADVSSTRVRSALAHGDPGLAARLLGRPHRVLLASDGATPLNALPAPGEYEGKVVGSVTASLASGADELLAGAGEPPAEVDAVVCVGEDGLVRVPPAAADAVGGCVAVEFLRPAF